MLLLLRCFTDGCSNANRATEKDRNCEIRFIVSWMSGLNQHPAKVSALVTPGSVGSNPTLTAKFSTFLKNGPRQGKPQAKIIDQGTMDPQGKLGMY